MVKSSASLSVVVVLLALAVVTVSAYRCSDGTVNWFNEERGIGFITPVNPDLPDVFFNFQAIHQTDHEFRTLAAGEQVYFCKDPEGMQAYSVKRISDL